MADTYLHSDLEGRSRRVLLPEVFDYFAGGASAELTLQRNRTAWSKFFLVPKLTSTPQDVDVGVTFLGRRRPTALVISPMARLDLLGSGDERDAAIAAGLCGVSFTVSSRSSVRASMVAESFRNTSEHQRVLVKLSRYHRGLYEELRQDEEEEPAFLAQLYLLANQKLTDMLVDEAIRSGPDALVVTLDTPVLGVRMRDIRRDFRIGPGALEELAGATAGFDVGGDTWWHDTRQSPMVTDETLEALVHQSKLPVFVKGVLSSSVLTSINRWGGSGVWISNHGGRQLDHVSTSVEALAFHLHPDQAAFPCEVVVDGGVRSAHEVVVAGSLGAVGVGIGRSAAWAFVLGGSVGLASYLLELRMEIKKSLVLLGVPSYGALSSEYLVSE